MCLIKSKDRWVLIEICFITHLFRIQINKIMLLRMYLDSYDLYLNFLKDHTYRMSFKAFKFIESYQNYNRFADAVFRS